MSDCWLFVRNSRKDCLAKHSCLASLLNPPGYGDVVAVTFREVRLVLLFEVVGGEWLPICCEQINILSCCLHLYVMSLCQRHTC